MTKLSRFRTAIAANLTEPIIRRLVRTHITPNTVTWLGFAITLVAAVSISMGWLFVAGIIVLVAGFFDMLDGALARYTGLVTRTGAMLDSVLDRVSEAVVLIGILIWYVREVSTLIIVLVAVTLISSQMVSYIRARAEALGYDCKVGIFTRAERVIVIAIGLLVDQIAIALGIVAVFSMITAGQRYLYVRKQMDEDEYLTQ